MDSIPDDLLELQARKRRRRFYAACRSEARASGNILPFSSLAAASTRLIR